MLVALTTTGVASKNGVGYFQLDYSDNKKTMCEFNPYMMYDNRKKVYTMTESSTFCYDSYTPARDTILSCPRTF